MNKTKIDWENPEEGWKLDYTWNPVVGCRHGCDYCYARRMNDRFGWITSWNEPEFFPDRLKKPMGLSKWSTIYVGSMCDLFGKWVNKEWLDRILEVIWLTPGHRYMFLTKNPGRYHEIIFPENVWLGTTVESLLGLGRLDELKSYNNAHVHKFISIEPLLSTFKFIDFSSMDLVIVGGMTGPSAVVQRKDWIKSIDHSNIYYKNNLKWKN
ncbi:hypothetical protein A2Z67_02360 [Candidatus Woesebacteria bacterium RBG_13_36_22]|uniref:DUF5131 family protein n=1 Tax=Candidatus Woesebacteria bacterium RBG_13_36_22 TaxID=1802478 RepID=A0A1F7X1H9_9BACT|nr:MAG: hypothetical protein A2Z67_02360 [Candidatus Woesebacteria bacterium RBG_13_36_22]